MGYIKLRDYASQMGIKKGDIVFVSSDSKLMLFEAMQNGQKPELNDFIDGLIEQVGDSGTVIFPTYNWDFCGGVAFDYKNTESKTGSIGSIALKRGDFKRTKHPIYSFAVYGKYQKELCEMENIDSFGLDSPFAFFKEKNVKNYIIDVSLCHCFTFTHFVEEHSGQVNYRFIKDFTSDYFDENGECSTRTYSMFVRYLDKDVITTIDPIEKDLKEANIEREIRVNSSFIKEIYLGEAYDVLLDDILNNRSRKLCTYNGQDEM